MSLGGDRATNADGTHESLGLGRDVRGEVRCAVRFAMR